MIYDIECLTEEFVEKYFSQFPMTFKIYCYQPELTSLGTCNPTTPEKEKWFYFKKYKQNIPVLYTKIPIMIRPD